MSSEPVRIGLVGAGKNTRERHIPGFNSIDGVELASVSNRTRRSGQSIADEYGIPKVYDRWTDLIAAPDTDAICIGTWPYMHKPIVLAALEAGKHVMTEARLAMNVTQAREMLEASRARPDLVAQVVPAGFTFPVDSTVSELIADGYLGDIMSADVTVSASAFIDREAPFVWRHDLDLSGYNIMLMGAVYECLMRWLGHATSVTALSRVNVKARRDGGILRAVPVPDHVEVLCEMASGPILRMRFSEVTGLDRPQQVWLFGSEGTLKIRFDIFRWEDPQHVGIWGGRRGDSALSEIAVPQEKRGRWRVEEEFVNAIRGEEPVTRTRFEDGVQYMELTEAVTRSAQSRKTVFLPL